MEQDNQQNQAKEKRYISFDFPYNITVDGVAYIGGISCTVEDNNDQNIFSEAFSAAKQNAIDNNHVNNDQVLITTSDAQAGIKNAIDNSPRSVLRTPFWQLLDELTAELSTSEKQQLAANPNVFLKNFSEVYFEKFKALAAQSGWQLTQLSILCTNTPEKETSVAQTVAKKIGKTLLEKLAGIAIFLIIVAIAAYYILSGKQ